MDHRTGAENSSAGVHAAPNLGTFAGLFDEFRELNPRAHELALQQYLAIIEICTAPAINHQLLQSINDAKASCLNELQSIIHSIESRELTSALTERIRELDQHLERVRSAYMRRLPVYPTDTTWQPHSLGTGEQHPQPYIVPSTPEQHIESQYQWHIAENHY
jgi:hypothetical protein